MSHTDKEQAIARVQAAIEAVRAGKMVILVDDEDRENEGDLTMAAEMITPEAITFMATKGCGRICVTLTPERVNQLELPMMVKANQSPLGTAFTVSIEAAKGVSTGISSADRAQTIRVAASPFSKSTDLVSPGHVFPLRAMPGGVLQRTGQTEGSVDLMRLAGLEPAGVICEVMKEDGTMARYEDLQRFSQEHDMVLLSIADLIVYRLQYDRLVERKHTGAVTLGTDAKAEFQLYLYGAVPGIARQEYIALTLGDVADGEPVPCRAHVACFVDDVLGAGNPSGSPSLRAIIDAIIRRGRGVVIFLPSRESLYSELDVQRAFPDEASAEHDNTMIREYGIGAQILLDLGIRRPQFISNNPHRLVGLSAWGFESTEQITLEEV